MEVIVHFLALLELCKLGKVSLGQGQTFGDLQVAWIADDRPAGRRRLTGSDTTV